MSLVDLNKSFWRDECYPVGADYVVLSQVGMVWWTCGLYLASTGERK